MVPRKECCRRRGDSARRLRIDIYDKGGSLVTNSIQYYITVTMWEGRTEKGFMVEEIAKDLK